MNGAYLLRSVVSVGLELVWGDRMSVKYSTAERFRYIARIHKIITKKIAVL